MGRPGEDKLTNAIKSALEGYEPKYNPAAWNKLSAKLNQPVSATPTFKPWVYGFVCGVLIMLGGYYLLQPEESNLSESIDKKILTEIEVLRTEIRQLKEVQLGYQQQLDNANSQIANVSSNNANSYKSVFSDRYVFLSPQNTNNKTGFDKDLSLLKKMTPLLEIKRTGYVLGIDSLVNGSVNNNVELAKTTSKNKKHLKLKWPEISFNLEGYEKFTGPDKLFVSAGIQQEGKIGKINCTAKELSVGLSGNLSDCLTVFGGGIYGTNLGSDEKKLWYSKKVTEPDSIYYKQVSDTTSIKKLSWKYIDIPLGFSYRFYKNQQHSISFNLSAISRIYLNEEYTDMLDIKDKPSEIKVTEIKSGEHVHLFNKLKLGLNYNYQVSKHWSLQAVPSFIMPLRKHSYLNVSNSSWGMNLNLVYRFKKQDGY